MNIFCLKSPKGAPTARYIKVQGKREARRPGLPTSTRAEGLKGRNTQGISPFQGWNIFDCLLPGATRSASLRACPWLSYSAPSALRCDF